MYTCTNVPGSKRNSRGGDEVAGDLLRPEEDDHELFARPGMEGARKESLA
jgi:hypothetical protein